MRHVLLVLLLAAVCAAGSLSARAQNKKAPATLDAVLRVKVDVDAKKRLVPSCQFDHPGKVGQSFHNSEYRYAVLDKDGVQVKEAVIFREPDRTISLTKGKMSDTDGTDAEIVKEKLKSGEEYYFVVSVRDLTGFAKFKAP